MATRGSPDGISKRTGTRGTTWQARIDLGPDPATGRRRQLSRTFATRRAAGAWRMRELTQRRDGQSGAHDQRALAVYLHEWLARRRGIRDSSRLLYSRWLRLYIVPYLGHVPLAGLRAAHIHTLLYGTLAGRGLSGATLRKVYSLLHHALRDAERLDLVARNECARVDAPAADARPRPRWTAPHTRAYLATARHNRHWPLWLLAVHTGMRRGELCGLRWCDLDLGRGMLAVEQQVTCAPGGTHTGDPKTASSRRLVTLAPSCVAALRRHRTSQGERRLLLGPRWEDHDLVFPSDGGRPLHPSTITDAHADICIAAALPRIRLHDLRHSCASLLHSIGIPMRVVGDRLGHADLVMTGHYTHADLAGQHAAAEALARLLDEACDENVNESATGG